MILENLKKAINEYSALVFTFTLLVIIVFACILFNINYAATLIAVVCMVAVLFVMRAKKKALNNAVKEFSEYYKIPYKKIKRKDVRDLLQLCARKDLSEKELEIKIKKLIR